MPPSSNAFELYPNPAVDQLSLSYRLEERDDLAYEIYSLDGRLVQRAELDILDNEGEAGIAVDGLMPGAYLLKLTQQGRELERFKFIRLTD